MADQVSITINGVQFQATKGSLLIDKLLDEKKGRREQTIAWPSGYESF